MIVCQKCGFQNDNSATFCQNPSCQNYLEWSGEQVPTTQQPRIGPDGLPVRTGGSGSSGGPAGPGGGAGGAGGPAGGGGAGGGGTARPVDPAGARHSTADRGGAGGGSTARPVDPASPDDRTDPGATQASGPDPEALLVRPSRSGPRPADGSDGSPRAVKPAESKRPVEQTTKKGKQPQGRGTGGAPELKPGQSACPNCGWPVEAGWRFCHHCATSLSLPKVRVDATGGERTSRWSRRPPAGDRNFPDDNRRRTRLAVWLVALVVVAGAGVYAAINVLPSSSRSSSDETTTTIQRVVLVPVTGAKMIEASTVSGEHVGQLVLDGNPETFWSRRAPSDDDTPHLIFQFATQIQLARLDITSGASGDQFAKRARPKQIRLLFSDGVNLRFTLKDQPATQPVDFEPRLTRRIRIVVESTYPGTDPPPNGDRVSISEVSFFAKG
jgi:hypothetical protein